jgi:D-alanyl-D-alanine carboxypeptidase (penicillin-binding protein 5/6)
MALKYFLAEMNKLLKVLNINGTHFANPHGLSNKANYSTAEDVGKIAFFAMKEPIIR